MMLPESAVASDEVHVWWIALDQPNEVVSEVQRCLSADERARLARLAFGQHKRRFAVARGVLRHVLSAYCGVAPARLEFRYPPSGKPWLAGTRRVDFNLAYSAEVAVCAVACGRALGIDVERVRRVPEADDIIGRHAAPAERAAYLSLPLAEREVSFCTWWVRKEAYLKAVGHGLSQPLDRFAVTLTPDAPVRLLSVAEGPQGATRWTLRHLAAPAGFTACIAVEGCGWRVVERQATLDAPGLRRSSERWLSGPGGDGGSQV